MTSRNEMMQMVAPFMRRRLPMAPQYVEGQQFAGQAPMTAGEAVGGGVLGSVLDYGQIPAQIAADIAYQPVRAGEAVSDAVMQPDIPNTANAAFQTGMALFRPAHALGALGAGYVGALANDLGAFDTAASAAPAPTADEIGGYLPESGKVAKAEKALEGSLDRKRDEALIEAEAQAKIQSAVAAAKAEAESRGDIAKEDAEQKRALYDQQVAFAEKVRDDELARDRRFADTDMGKLYDKSGGAAALLAGAGAGALRRLAKGPAESGNLMLRGMDTSLPKEGLKTFGEGAGLGVTAFNLPLLNDAFLSPVENPEKRAYQAYSRELPQGHPRKQEFADYAGGLPNENQTREQAQAEFYDPVKFAERAAAGAVEGGLGAFLGKYAASLPRAAGSAANEMLAYRLPAGRQVPTRPVGPTGGSPQGPGPAAPGGNGANQPVPPQGGPQVPPQGPKPSPPKPPRGGPGGPKGGQSPRLSVSRKNSILDEMAAGNTPQAASATEQAYIQNLNNQAQSLSSTLGIPVSDVLRSMSNAVASGARKTPYAVPAAVAGGTAFDQALESYRQIVIDVDGDGIPDVVVPQL